MTSRAADRPLRVLVPFSSEPHAARAPLTAVEGALGRGGRGSEPRRPPDGGRLPGPPARQCPL